MENTIVYVEYLTCDLSCMKEKIIFNVKLILHIYLYCGCYVKVIHILLGGLKNIIIFNFISSENQPQSLLILRGMPNFFGVALVSDDV